VTAVWMLYCVGIGLAFVVVGYALDKALHYAGLPTRWAWVIALAGSHVIPAAAWLRPEAFATFAAPVTIESALPQSGITSTSSTVLRQPLERSFSLSDLDRPLAWTWLLGSFAMVVSIAFGARRLVTLRRRWQPARVDGRDVLISPNVGPAVVGVWSPRVVLPEWALQLPEQERELMFAHEEQHMSAADPVLNAAGFWLTFLAPWNLALWWQWRRLRLAIEVDCDARVLRQGCSPAAYGDLLLRVSKGRRAQLVGVAAFGEPISFLESRIRRMVSRMPRWRWTGVAVAVSLAATALAGACEAPRPLAPSTRSEPAQMALAMTDRLSLQQTERLRSWVAENARRMFPAILEPHGPTMDAYLIHDSGLQVYRSALVTLHYMNGKRDDSAIGVAALKDAFPSFDPGHDGWAVLDPRGLRGLVRDNVRVIRIHHDPQPPDRSSVGSQRTADAEMRSQGEQVLRLARQYHPEMLGRRDTQIAIGLVLDSQWRVVAHAASANEHRDDYGVSRVEQRDTNGVIMVSEDCLGVLHRLLPRYKSTPWTESGCAGGLQPNIVVYWARLRQ
jgi:beta-lactamase regulating signal transducer with metallopeptidase domain